MLPIKQPESRGRLGAMQCLSLLAREASACNKLSSAAAGEAAIETGNAAAHGNTSYAIGVPLSFVELMTDARPMLCSREELLN